MHQGGSVSALVVGRCLPGTAGTIPEGLTRFGTPQVLMLTIAAQPAGATRQAVQAGFPVHDCPPVIAVVAAAHTRLDRVIELITGRPRLGPMGLNRKNPASAENRTGPRDSCSLEYRGGAREADW